MVSSHFAECSSIDDSFGPYAGNCRGGFDFTLFFEEVVLTIPLALLFISIVPSRIILLRKRRQKCVAGYLLPAKLVNVPLKPTPGDVVTDMRE
jgi:hypothetical protein